MGANKIIIEVDSDGKVRGRHTMSGNRKDAFSLGSSNTENIIVDDAPSLSEDDGDSFKELYYDKKKKEFSFKSRKKREDEYSETKKLEKRIEKLEEKVSGIKDVIS